MTAERCLAFAEPMLQPIDGGSDRLLVRLLAHGQADEPVMGWFGGWPGICLLAKPIVFENPTENMLSAKPIAYQILPEMLCQSFGVDY